MVQLMIETTVIGFVYFYSLLYLFFLSAGNTPMLLSSVLRRKIINQVVKVDGVFKQ